MRENYIQEDTIAAIATAKGAGGVGIIRISGAEVSRVIHRVINRELKPRFAEYVDFFGDNGEVLDSGIAILFKAPNSFTGEDVLELQGHGGMLVLDCVLSSVLRADPNIRVARPGEFSERAFLNGKLDLAQAEAVLDLINAQTHDAARAAAKTVKGVFSARVNSIEQRMIALRVQVEALIDFPDEDIEFQSNPEFVAALIAIERELEILLQEAKIGTRLHDGINVVILGAPNVGKSSLLNALAKEERAIVTNIPGTTRDLLHHQIVLGGIGLNIIDTAGIRESADVIEQEGIRRAKAALKSADLVLFVEDCNNSIVASGLDNPSEQPLDFSGLFNLAPELVDLLPAGVKLIIVSNKIDTIDNIGASDSVAANAVNVRVARGIVSLADNVKQVFISARHSKGLDLLTEAILSFFALNNLAIESVFLTRQRHLTALESALEVIQSAAQEFSSQSAYELLAENLRGAHNFLGEITGKFSFDDLLGKIFSEFCIGK
jgi:tRNA modification GTPase